MEKLGNYYLIDSLTNKNAGYSVWGFAKKDGKDYFVKEFVDQKYPAKDKVSSPERLEKKYKSCMRFEQRKKALYQKLNENSDGNAVRVEEFFRIESKYYISMRKIKSLNWGVEDVAKLPIGEIRRLCAIIAHGVACLHKGHIIHADLKPDNILFMKTSKGYTTAKIIDFDSGFLESDPPEPGETIVGDFHYFSPEACRSIWGEEAKLTCKMDVFALGVLFHQYFTGELPGFNTKENSYSGEATAKGEDLTVSGKLPNDIRDLLTKMLNNDPEKRPTAMEVYSALRGIEVTTDSGSDTVHREKSNTARNEPVAKSLRIGDEISFGTKNRKELRWKVLAVKDNKVLIFSSENIGYKAYHEPGGAVTWKECTLRKWLNNDFLEEYFTQSEKEKILSSNVSNKNNQKYKTPGGEPTVDKIFLLSIDEAETLVIGFEFSPSEFSWCWLRSPGDSPRCAACINNGLVSSNGSYVNTTNCVFPALWIKPFEQRVNPVIENSTTKGNPFFRPGDL